MFDAAFLHMEYFHCKTPYRKMYSKVSGSVSKRKATELKGIRGLSHFCGIYIGGRDSAGSFVTALMRLDLHYIWLPT